MPAEKVIINIDKYGNTTTITRATAAPAWVTPTPNSVFQLTNLIGGKFDIGMTAIDNIVAYYASQKPQAADTVPSSAQELAAKCNRCHDDESNPQMVAPKMNGQDKDYLVMALRAYRDDKRESTTMHRMSIPYSNALIDSIASWYASQPAK